MYANELKEQEIEFERIYLDPNNPRFWDDRSVRDVSDAKIMDVKIQERTKLAIRKFGVDDLYLNILRNGFLPLDRIVVRPIDVSPGDFVVVEGNRRTAALQLLRQQIANNLIDQDGIDDTYLQRLKESTDRIKVLVYSGSDKRDIAWLLQGIRHISGIKDWGPAQQARLVADRVDNHGLTFTQAGQQFGISAQKVGKLYRTFKALKQMSSDDEFQSKADNRYFSLFEEAIRSKEVKDWLGWDDKANEFTERSNLQRFYAWISPDEEAPKDRDNDRRIHDPRDIKKLAFLLAEKQHGLMSKVDQWNLSLDQAYERAVAVPSKYHWREAIQEAAELISAIPQGAIKDETEEYLIELDQFATLLTSLRKMASALIAEIQI